MSHCVGHEQCPECAKLGNDRSGDNLAIYADGSQYCFSCGFYRKASGVQSFRKAAPTTDRRIHLPHDVTSDLPTNALEYLDKYALTKHECDLNYILWSDYWKRLIFPYFKDNNELIAWQGRSFDKNSKAKWYSQGDLVDFIYLRGNTKSKSVVLTEDIISAIKVARIGSLCTSPIFGSHVSTKRLLRLNKFYDTIYIWLDYDKMKYSQQVSNTARTLGINCRSIVTEKDPKEYTTQEINEWLYN